MPFWFKMNDWFSLNNWILGWCCLWMAQLIWLHLWWPLILVMILRLFSHDFFWLLWFIYTKIQGVLAIRGFWGKWKSANCKTANYKAPFIGSNYMSHKTFFSFILCCLTLMSNNLGISIVKIAIYSHFSSLKVEGLEQNPGGFRVLKNRELQNRELQNRKLQGLPVMASKYDFQSNRSFIMKFLP